MKFFNIRVDLRVALLYALFGGLWVPLSDRLLAAFVTDVSTLTAIQTSKDLAFVLGSALLIFLSLRHYLSLRDSAENKLRASEERFRSLIESLPQNIYSKDADGRFVFANQRYCRTQGKPLGEIVGKTDANLHPPDLAEKYQRDDRLVVETGRAIEFEEEHQPLDGDRFWVYVSKTPLYDAQGRIIGTLGIFWDITKRKQMEEALMRERLLLRTVIDNLPDAVYVKDRLGRKTLANRVDLDNIGRPEAEVLGKTDAELFPPQVAAGFEADDRTVLQTGQPVLNREELLVNDEKRQIWQLTSKLPLKDAAGQIVGLVGIGHDITERKQMEAALRESEKRYRDIFENATEGIFQSTPDGHYLSVNPAFAGMYGFSSPEEMIREVQDIASQLYANPQERQEIKRLLQDPGVVKDFEAQFRRKDGTPLWGSINARTVRDANGNVLYYEGTTQDITERKRAEEALRAASSYNRRLIEASIDPLVTIGPDGKITDVNEATETVTGVSREQLIGDDFLNYFTEPEKAEAGYQKVLAEGWVRDYPLTIRHTSGNTTAVLYNATVYENEIGEIQGVFAAARDVTERKRAEETIRRRNEELTALSRIGQAFGKLAQPSEIFELLFAAVGRLFDNRNLYIALCDEASQSISFPMYAINGEQRTPRGASRPFGNGLTEYVIRANAPLLIPRDLPAFLAEHGIDSIGTLSKCFLAAPMRAGERVIGVIAIQDYQRENVYDAHHIELLDTLAAQATIALENARLFGETLRLQEFNQSIVQNMGEGIAIEDVDGKFTFVNPAAAAMLGYAPEELLGQHWTLVIPPDQQPAVRAADERRKRGEADHYELELVRKDGQRLSVLISGSPRFEGDRFAGTLAVLTDIAERKRTELETRRLLDKADQSRRVLLGLMEDQKRAEADIQRHVRRLSTLREIDHALTSTLDLDQVLSTLLEQARNTADAETASIALVEAGTSKLIFRQAVGEAGPFVVGLRLSPGQGVAGWAVEHRQVALVSDAASDPRFWGSVSRGTGFVTRDVIAAPLVAHDTVTGVIELLNKRSGVFDQDDAQWLESVAAQAAIAIENARLFEREREQRQRLETLYRVGQAINSTLEVEAILDRLTDEAMRATHATHGSALVARTDLDRFDRRSLRGYTPEQAERARSLFLSLERGLNGHAYRTRQTVYLPDVRNDPDYFALIPETRSELVVPILRSGQVLANLDLQSPQVNAFDDLDAGLLQALVNQVAIALENARLFEATYRHLDEMAIVSQVALIGAASRPFDEAVARAVDGMCLLWPDSNVSFLFLDDTGQVLRLHPASRGVSPELIADFGVPLSQGVTGWAARERQPVRVGDVTQDSRYVVGMPGARSEMAAPLLVGERAIGVINVECPVPNSYSGDDLRVLTALASQLATIFEKSRLDAEVAAYTATLERRVEERTAELQQAHEKVSRALEQEKELGDLKSRFISMTSHEFRTPLTTILSSAEMLEHYGPRWTEEKRLTHFHRIKASVQNMTRLLEDVLILGRAEADRLEFDPAPMDLVQFCRELVEEMQLSAGSRHTLELTCGADYVQARMDEKLLRQILTNLLSNAIKYSPDGGVVHLALTCQAGRAIFQVRDHGIGIPEEAQARLFETFHRAKNVGTLPGTGLGLAIVKKSVDLHGGTIVCASQVGQGTTFTVMLPMGDTA